MHAVWHRNSHELTALLIALPSNFFVTFKQFPQVKSASSGIHDFYKFFLDLLIIQKCVQLAPQVES